jgi:hypothetical protein
MVDLWTGANSEEVKKGLRFGWIRRFEEVGGGGVQIVE